MCFIKHNYEEKVNAFIRLKQGSKIYNKVFNVILSCENIEHLDFVRIWISSIAKNMEHKLNYSQIMSNTCFNRLVYNVAKCYWKKLAKKKALEFIDWAENIIIAQEKGFKAIAIEREKDSKIIRLAE